MKPKLTVAAIQTGAARFAAIESAHDEPSLFGITDGKAVGTYLEHKFIQYLRDHFEFSQGSSARGIDFPSLDVDIKTTSIRQPQSSCPSNPRDRRSSAWDTRCSYSSMKKSIRRLRERRASTFIT